MANTFIVSSDEEFLGTSSKASLSAKLLSDEEFLGESQSSTSDESLQLSPTEEFEDKTIRPKIEQEKQRIREAVQRGIFTSTPTANEEGQVSFEKPPAQNVAESLLLPPYSGLRGAVEGGASMLTELPRLVGQVIGAVGGAAGAIQQGENVFEGARQGAESGGDLVKRNVPSFQPVTPQGVTGKAVLEFLLEEAIKGGEEGLPKLAKYSPLYHMLSSEQKTQYEATLAAIGSGGTAAAPFLLGFGRRPPTVEQATAKLKELQAQKDARPDLESRKAQPPSEPVQYATDAEFLQPKEESTTPYRQDLGEPVRVTPEERTRITGDQPLVRPGEEIQLPAREIPKRTQGILEFESPEYAPSVLKKQEGLGKVEKEPWELSGRPGAEGIDPTTLILRFAPDLVEQIAKTEPYYEQLLGHRKAIGEQAAHIERLNKEKVNNPVSSPEFAKLADQVQKAKDAMDMRTEEMGKLLNTKHLYSFNPAMVLD